MLRTTTGDWTGGERAKGGGGEGERERERGREREREEKVENRKVGEWKTDRQQLRTCLHTLCTKFGRGW